MAVNINNFNPEDQQLENAIQADRESDFASKFVQSMDLPESLANAVDGESKKQLEGKPRKKEEPKAVEQEEEVEEEASESSDDLPQEESSEPQSDDDIQEEEDLIPKSKVQKRFDELTREKAILEERIKALEESRNSKEPSSDDERLERMSVEELKALKAQTRMAQRKADDDTYVKLLDLEEKIDRTIQTAPNRFSSKQEKHLMSALKETESKFENFESVKPKLFKTAQEIFLRQYPELQKMEEGQKIAWKMAVNEFERNSKVVEGKSKVEDLSRQVNSLKRKVSIETPAQKKVNVEESYEKLTRRAKQGTEADKLNWIKRTMNTDNMFSDAELHYRR